jgi:hypothetical protein
MGRCPKQKPGAGQTALPAPIRSSIWTIENVRMMAGSGALLKDPGLPVTSQRSQQHEILGPRGGAGKAHEPQFFTKTDISAAIERSPAHPCQDYTPRRIPTTH